MIAAVLLLIAAGAMVIPSIATALTPGQPVGTNFPRLGLMWPNPYLQKTELIAQYDYVTLHPTYVGKVPELRALNPDIIVLTSTNACELELDSSDAPSPGKNVGISKVPNAWIQTQLGSTLAVSASSDGQTLSVKDASRFRVGDVLVFGADAVTHVESNELAKVIAVDLVGKTITVVRGRIPERSPAAEHSAGTRVAAAVVFWPGSVVMDLSSYCPTAKAVGSTIPETWAQYNARTGADLLDDAELDGVFIDRSNSNPYINAVFTRSIDPSRTNIPVTDGYAALKSSWNTGLTNYERLLRERSGGKVILANNGHPNFAYLNGSVLENVPRNAPKYTTPEWLNTVYGPNNTSYSAFMSSSQQPNLTTLETYEVEESPTSGGRPANPFSNPLWKPDYRKMRFGLGTTLLNDGFFTYAIGTFGHSALGIMSFDEYDNAGAGRGYLGKPIGSARLALPPLASPDLLKGDGSFSTSAQMSRWFPWSGSGYSITKARSSDAAKITITRSRGAVYGATFAHHKVPVSSGSVYTLSFRARASRPLDVSAGVGRITSPYTNYLPFGQVSLGTSWKNYTLVTTSKGSASAATISFGVGQKTGTVWIDDVKLQKGWRPSVYRREFQNGIALVNPELTSIAVPLTSKYRKIDGRQDPAVNNGAYVSSVTLPGQDGLILLTTPPLSISSDRTLDYGSATNVAGVLKSTLGAPLSGNRVVLKSSVDGKSWASVAETRTITTGAYSFTVKPTRNTFYSAWSASDGRNLQGFSRVMAVKVKVRISNPAARSTMSPTKYYAVSGTLDPRHTAGTRPVRIYKYRYESGRWKSYGYYAATASDYSGLTKYTARVRLPYKGKWRLRAYHPADAGHAATWSGYDYVTVN